MLKPGFVADTEAALGQAGRAHRALRRRRRLRRRRPRPVQRGRGVRGRRGDRHLPQARTCPTTPSSTRPATSRPGDVTDPLELYVIGGVRVGVSICEDIWSPDGPLAEQAAGGAELVVNINASPYHLGKAAYRERMLATRAADAHVRAGVRQPGRRAGRAGVRRLLAGVRRRRRPARPRSRSSSRTCSSSTCRRRGVPPASARPSRSRVTRLRCRRSRSSSRQPVRRATPRPSPIAGDAARPDRRALRGARARHPRLHREERLQRRRDRAVRAASTRRSSP